MLIAKDRIKETLHDALGPAGHTDLAWSQQLGAASMELLWTLAVDAPAVVLEAKPVDIQLVAAEVWRLLGVSQPAACQGGEPVSAEFGVSAS
jgi:hypothetical protein